MAVILQPCASKEASEHYNNTVKNNSLKLEKYKDFFSIEDYDRLKRIYPDGNIKVWGVFESNLSKWMKMMDGDIVLFSADNHIYSSATVTYKLENAELASELWGKDKYNRSWKLIYFLDELENLHIPYEDFNKIVGYSPNYIIQGFNVLNNEKSSSFLTIFPLESERYLNNTYSKKDYIDLLKKKTSRKPNFNGNLNRDTMVKSRVEQGFLRDNLFGNNYVGRCSICGRELPIEFLWCSHIKKRSKCTLEELIDYEHIVTPMCKLGCDDLFERGYIGVEDGKIIYLKKSNNDVIDKYIDALIGRDCQVFCEENKKYFEAHIKNFK